MLSEKSAIRSQVANVCCELRMELANKVSAGNPGSPHRDREQPELGFRWALNGLLKLDELLSIVASLMSLTRP